MYFDTIYAIIIMIPLNYYKNFKMEQYFGFNKMTVKTFICDQFRELMLNLVLIPPAMWLVLWVLRIGGTYFYIYAMITLMLILFLLATIYPNVIQPMYNKFTDIEDGHLKKHIEEMLVKEGFPVKNIFQIDGSTRSKHSNAYFYGFGSNKHVVVYDTLIKKMSHEQIMAILYHELGHWKKNHFWLKFLYQSVTSISTPHHP